MQKKDTEKRHTDIPELDKQSHDFQVPKAHDIGT